MCNYIRPTDLQLDGVFIFVYRLDILKQKYFRQSFLDKV